ncbi:hypothetical protein HPB48_000404 [Haemaphysalis longicornis]|uniref:Uncharacterized protein n=1 Tax=Haemaphysalis longicornis TaxID=44386 RepID=A0A9J6G1M1_HAELO|nr:hypothetical protein HPB48_000404 [Haemaphysalis longicornis]
MAGKYSTMHAGALKKKIILHANFISCVVHSWSGHILQMIAGNKLLVFLGFCSVYVFFTASLGCAPASLETKRGSCYPKASPRHAVVSAIECNEGSAGRFKKNQSRLVEELEDHDERAEKKHVANALLRPMTTLETALLAAFWDIVLQRFNLNAICKELQRPTLSLNAAASLMK